MQADDLLEVGIAGELDIAASCIGEQAEEPRSGSSARELVRAVAPVLTERVSDQAVLDDAHSERTAIYLVAEPALHIEVVGDLVIVKNHVRRDIRECTADARQGRIGHQDPRPLSEHGLPEFLRGLEIVRMLHEVKHVLDGLARPASRYAGRPTGRPTMRTGTSRGIRRDP